MAIGVFDSGLGGLSVLMALRARLPRQAFVFLGDNANAPYGTRAPEEIHALTRAGVARLFEAGCQLVILACNTASAVALRALQEDWLPRQLGERRVLGVFVPTIEALTGRPWAYAGPPLPGAVSRVALFATPATVESHAFPRELRLRAEGVSVTEQPCPDLVDTLEAGDWTRAEALVARYCAALLAREPAPEAAVLGCTHYPLAREAFRAALPRGTLLHCQPATTAESLDAYLTRHPRFRSEGGLRCLTTGHPATVATHAKALTGLDSAFVPA
ncbi:MAG: aspartate/glutamate racemase family protein [Pseudomonadota bacterium]